MFITATFSSFSKTFLFGLQTMTTLTLMHYRYETLLIAEIIPTFLLYGQLLMNMLKNKRQPFIVYLILFTVY